MPEPRRAPGPRRVITGVEEQDLALPLDERALLSAALLSPEVAALVAAHEPDDWWTPFHREVAAAISELVGAGSPVTTWTVGCTMGKTLQGHGGFVALARLESDCAPAAAAPWHSQRLRRARIKRDFYRALLENLAELAQHDPDELQENILAAFRRIDLGEPAPALHDLLAGRVTALREQARAGVVVAAGLPSPWRSLDRLGAVLAPGEVTVLAGRTSRGKSAVALNWAVHAAWSGWRVVYVSLEMSAASLADRTLAMIAGISASRTRSGHYLSATDLDACDDAAREAPQNVRVLDCPGLTVAEVVARLRSLRADRDTLVVLDYLQLLRPANPRLPREQQVAELSRDCKTTIAGGLGCPLLLVCQTRRPQDDSRRRTRVESEPTLHELRESGAIENDADAVILVHRPNFAPDEPLTTRLDLIVAKQRNGPTGRTSLLFFRETQAITEAAP